MTKGRFFNFDIKCLIKHHKNLAIQVLLIAISMVVPLVFMIAGHLRSGDLTFNYLRLKDASLSLNHLQWPQFDFYTSSILGNATNTMYPWLIMTPLLPLMNILSPVLWWTTAMGSGVLVSLEATYFAFRSLDKTRRYALWTSLIYSLSTMTMNYVYGQFDIGSLYATAVAPLVFAGWLAWLRKDRWKMMTAGLLLMTCSNIASSVAMILLILLSTAFFWKDLTVKKLWTAVKAGIVYTLASAVIWLPILIIDANNKLMLPAHTAQSLLVKTSAYPVVIFNPLWLFIPETLLSWSYLDVVGLFLAVKYWKRLSALNHKFVEISLIILFTNLKPVDLWLISHTFLDYLQFMRRFSFFSHLLLTVVLLNIIFGIIAKQRSKGHVKNYFKWFGMILTSCMILGGVEELIDQTLGRPFSTFNYVRDRQTVQEKLLYNSQDLRSNQMLHDLPCGYIDYYPHGVKHFTTHKRSIHVILPKTAPHNYRGNKFIFNAKSAGERTVPIVIYHAQTYHVRDNGKQVPVRSHRGYLQVPSVKGRNVIVANTPVMTYRYLAMLMSLTGVVILIFRKKKRGHKNVQRIKK